MSRRLTFLTLALALTAAPALAEVKSAAPHGFEIGGALAIDASPARVWTVLTAPEGWWSRDHRWFPSSTLSLDLSPGGCWCERTDGGAASRHLETALVEPGSRLVLRGALGPLQGQGVDGGLSFSVKAEGEGAVLTWSYVVGGHAAGGVDAWAGPVDGVLSAQLANLKARAEGAD